VIISTTHGRQGKRIVKYLGLVSGEAIMGANLFEDLFAGIRDIVGGRSGAYEEELQRARAVALDQMQQQASALQANAVLGVDGDSEVIDCEQGEGGRSSMLMVAVSGTAVVLERWCWNSPWSRARAERQGGPGRL
jgi:uncharacterized protein YbjQ (UPF0145 family)